MSPRVLFEPIGEEIDCGEEETVLEAAFRQGYNLAYGCREGQCSACKCYLLEGEVELLPYSTFALSESEEANGYTLLCRAMPYDDLVVELLHFDPDNYRLENPIRDGVAQLEALEWLTDDIGRLDLRVRQPVDFSFLPGQYVDLWVPGADDARRSFSMANLPGAGRIELMVKRYPGGRFSGLLERSLLPGDELRFTGPYGAFHLRRSGRPVLLVAGGSGMAPILSLLRELERQRTERMVRFFYGARTRRDLFHLEQIAALGAQIADFRFTPVLSEEEGLEDDRPADTAPAFGFVHDRVGEYLASGEMEDLEAYMCGPPAMIDAASELLARHGVDDSRIFHDKFTIAADAAERSETR
jgi:propane monooxygenase reductase subunit